MLRTLVSLFAGTALLLPMSVGCQKTKEGKSFTVTQPGDVTVQPQGEQQMIEVSIERKGKFDGELKAEISDLPDGVEVTEDSVTISKNAKTAKFMLKAEKDAKPVKNHTAKITVAANDESIPVTFKITVASAEEAVNWDQKAAKLKERVQEGIKTVDEKIAMVKTKLDKATKDEQAALKKTMNNLNEKRKELQKDLAHFGKDAANWTKERYNEVASSVEEGLNNLHAWLKKQFSNDDS